MNFDGEALLFTQVAETKDLESLVKKLPNIHFNIAAYTPMAWLLVKLTKYDNVSLYPSIVYKKLAELIDNCDVYLDISYGPKEANVFSNVIHQDIPTLAFEATKDPNLHRDNYHVFKDDEVDQIAKAKEVLCW